MRGRRRRELVMGRRDGHRGFLLLLLGLLIWSPEGSVPTPLPTPSPSFEPTFQPSPLPTMYPTQHIVGSDAGLGGTSYDPMSECPRHQAGECPWHVETSNLWDEEHFQPCRADDVNLFFEDPTTGGVVHACNVDHVHAMPRSCLDVTLHDMSIDPVGQHLYYSTGHSIRRKHIPAPANDDHQDIVSGFTRIHIQGFNFGESAEGLSVSIRGFNCSTVILHNSTDVSCITGDPRILSAPIESSCVSLTVAASGTFSGEVSHVIATAKHAAGYRKPLVHTVTSDSRGFRPTTVAVDLGRRRIFWANKVSGTIQSSTLDGQSIHQLVSRVHRVFDLVIHSTGSALFFSDAESSSIRRCVLAGRSYSDHTECVPDTVVSGITNPRGIQIDEKNSLMFLVDGSRNRIHRLDLSLLGDGLAGPISSPLTLSTAVQLAQIPANIQLSELGVLPASYPNPNFDFDLRLLWAEINTDRIQRATIHGTKKRPLESVPTYGKTESLLWPRSIVVDSNRSSVFVGEYLGKVWEFPLDGPSTASSKLFDLTEYAGASQIYSFFGGHSSVGSERVRSFLRLPS